MTIPFDDDLSSILQTTEFAVSASYNGATINGIFDNETVPYDGGGFVTIHQEQPRFLCKTSDVPSVAENQQLVISATTYDIKAWVHDGTGTTVLQLEKV